MYKYLLLLTLINLTGCAGVFPGRTFIDEMDRDSDGIWVPGNDFQMVSGDEGHAYRAPEEIARRTPASNYERQQILADRSVEAELARKVNALDEMAYAQYARDKQVLATPSEKIYYLDLSPRERAEYIALKQGGNVQVTDKPYAYLSNYSSAEHLSLRSYYKSRYEENALQLGMSKQEVVGTWGEPQAVDFAGDPRLQNERWSFREQNKVHQVYFEGGRVQGWALD